MGVLTKELWLEAINYKEWFDDDIFIQDGINCDEFVENDRINWAFAGAASAVVKNPVGPLVPTISGATERTDTGDYVELDNYSTIPRAVRDAEAVELAYNKLVSVVEQDKNVIKEAIISDFLYAIAPLANTATTPILTATGAASTTDGRATITKEDIKNLAIQFDNLKYPKANRRIIMSPDAAWNLVDNTQALINQYVVNDPKGTISGKITHIHSFDVIIRTDLPFYDAANNKLPQGSTPIAGTDGQGCFAYVAQKSWKRAFGSIKMYDQIDDVYWQGTLISFRARAAAKTESQDILGAIKRV